MATKPVKGILKQVKPILSADSQDARKRVLKLYKSWLRHLEPIIISYRLPVTVIEAKQKLRQEFVKNQHLTDIRAIDVLVVKGQMELKEIMYKWKQNCHVMYYFTQTHTSRPTSFLSKFLSGAD